MSFETVRAAVAAHVNTAWLAAATGYTMEMDNLYEIDHASQTAPFVTFQLKWRDATQASLENTPTTRYDGEAMFHIHMTRGAGTKPAHVIADTIAAFMKYANVSNVQFQTPRLMSPAEYEGWLIWPLAISFFYRE
jgi:hypothetical protein